MSRKAHLCVCNVFALRDVIPVMLAELLCQGSIEVRQYVTCLFAARFLCKMKGVFR